MVEGDDLSHKIWGLGIDDSQVVYPAATTRPPVRQPQDYRPSQVLPTTATGQDGFTLSHYYERDAIIDLSRPATFYGHVGTQRVLSKQNVKPIAPTLPMSTSQKIRIPQLTEVESFATLRAKNLKFEEVYKAGHSSTLAVGLGLHTWSSRESRPESISPMCEISSNPLNTAATVFVPASANMKPYPSKQRYTPPSEKPLPYTFTAPRRSLVFNNAAEQHWQPDSQSLLPTPPSTSSPCWTPIFSHQPEMAISTLDPKVSKADSYSPSIYSSISDLEDDFGHIRIITQQNATHETDVAYDPRTHSCQDPFTFQIFVPNTGSPQLDVSSCLSATPGSLHDPLMAFSTNHENGNLLQAEPLQTSVVTQGSTKRRSNLSYQQPRSIPLARLIQRRLSSVAEENLSTKTLFPFFPEAQTGGITRLKGSSLEPLGRQMPRIGLLDEEISTTEIFSVRTEPDYQHEAKSILSSGESNVVVKLPTNTGILPQDVDSSGGQHFGKVTRQAVLDTTK